MTKTIITAILTFLGLKVTESVFNWIRKIVKFIWICILLLVFLRVGIPLSIWYGREVGKAISPVTKPIAERLLVSTEQQKIVNEYYRKYPQEKPESCLCDIRKENQ